GLVPLDIDQEGVVVKAEAPRHLLQPVGAGGVIRGGHHHLAAKAPHRDADAGIVGGDGDTLGTGGQGLLVNPLDHGLAANVPQRLGGQAGGGVTGRYHDVEGCVHSWVTRLSMASTRVCMPLFSRVAATSSTQASGAL